MLQMLSGVYDPTGYASMEVKHRKRKKKTCRTFFSYIGVKESKLFLDFIMLALKHLSIMFNQLSLALRLS